MSHLSNNTIQTFVHLCIFYCKKKEWKITQTWFANRSEMLVLSSLSLITALMI